jgi:hypothetical protein
MLISQVTCSMHSHYDSFAQDIVPQMSIDSGLLDILALALDRMMLTLRRSCMIPMLPI